jgi:hypothetical protein
MHPEAVEGLLEEGVLAESGLPTESTAAVGAGEEARCTEAGHRVADGQGRVVGSKRKELLPELFLELPQVGCLPREGGAMDLTECREPLCVVPSEVAVECFVGVEPQKLSDDLDGENLGVGKHRGGATLTDTPSFELIVHQTEDSDDEGAKIHERKTSFCSRWIGAPPRVGRSSTLLKFSTKLAHGVS